MKNYPEEASVIEPSNPTVRITSSDQRVDSPAFDAKNTGGQVGEPVYATNQGSDIHNVSLNYDGGINISASSENLSAKFKYPTVSEDVPAKGQNQYE